MRQNLILTICISLYAIYTSAQCSSVSCSLCDVTATVTSVGGGTLIEGSAAIPGTLSATNSHISEDTLVVYSNSCGELQISIELNFDWNIGINFNWIHGVSFESSNNWIAAEGVIIPPNPGWIFLNSITGVCSGRTYGAGYYWDRPGVDCAQNRSDYNGSICLPSISTCEEDDSFLVDGDPRDNFGINCFDDCPQFGFDLVYCPAIAGTNTELLTFTLTEDGETGGYSRSDDCIFTLSFPIRIISEGIQIDDLTQSVCKDSCVILDAGVVCDSYEWSTGETTQSIEVCPTVDTTYSITVTASTGCAVISDIAVIIEDCCAANAGIFTDADTLVICPFDTPKISIQDYQQIEGYYNYLYTVQGNSITHLSLDSFLIFESPTYQFDYALQCKTFTIYSVNIFGDDTIPFPATSKEDLYTLSGCFDIDSLKVIIQDDENPTFDYNTTNQSIIDTSAYTENIYLSCIGDLPTFPEIQFKDNCKLKSDTTFVIGELLPCESGFISRFNISSDYCNNNAIFKQLITLEPDSFYYDIDVKSENCLGENNGSIHISNQSYSNTYWSLDGSDFSTDTTFMDLSPGTHYLEAIDLCGCPHYDTLYIDSGPELTIDILETRCNNNETLGVPLDDTQIITFIITSINTLSDSCQLTYQNNTIHVAYGDEVTIESKPNTSSINLVANDLINIDCITNSFIEGLTNCSGICALTPQLVNQKCNDNDTRGYPFDDFYELSILVTVENSTSNGYILSNASGMEIGTYTYGSTHTFTLPAYDMAEEIFITDLELNDCTTSVITDNLTTCSGTCNLVANISDIECHDNGTINNTDDDTWSFRVTATIEDGSNTCRLEVGTEITYFESGDTIILENNPFDIQSLNIVVSDSMLMDCNFFLTAIAPETCSPCIHDLQLIPFPESCIGNADGALYINSTETSIKDIFIDGAIYQESSKTLSAGIHKVDILYGDSCTLQSTITIETLPLHIVTNLGPYEIVEGESIDLGIESDIEVGNISTITWSPNIGLSCYDCFEPTFHLDSSIVYTATIENIYGCVAADSVFVDVLIDAKVYFPNIIRLDSPFNGCFYPISNDDETLINELKIYDRWGGLVFDNSNFEANRSEEGWCGVSNNNRLNQGVYVYICSVTLNNGSREMFVGDVTLIH